MSVFCALVLSPGCITYMYMLYLIGYLRHDDFHLSQYVVKKQYLCMYYTKMKSSLHYPVITFRWFCNTCIRKTAIVHFLLIP